ncbi:MAG: MOP flippase family protein [Acidobacterium ailaaui]|nr:MOP flippase family protein [Pseudacidobacterium ailaaui]
MTLRHQTIKGVAWNSIGRISNQALQFGLSVILMRLLSPSDYGLLAMAMVVTGFAGIFNEFGLGSAIIQRKQIAEQQLSTVFWLNMGIGAGITLLFWTTAPWIADFFHTSNLRAVLQWLSFIFLLGAASVVPGALLQRKMRFDQLTKISVVGTAISGLVAVYMAYTGWGVMSLVAQSLINGLVVLPLNYRAAGWYPKWMFSWQKVRPLFSFSAYLTGFNVINYWARRSDDLLIGKWMGAASLGIYSRAYNLMLLPITQIISLVSNVMLPALSSVQDQKERVKSIYLRVIQVIAFLSFPMMVGLCVTADDFILGIFGQKWVEVVPLIRILSIVGLLQSVGNPTGWIYLSQGKTDWMFWWGVFGSGTVVIALVIGALMGSVYTVAIAYLIVNVLLLYPVNAIPGKLIGLGFMELVVKLLPMLGTSLLMGVSVWAIHNFLPSAWPHVYRLMIEVGSGIALYLIFTIVFRLEVLHQMQLLLQDKSLIRKSKTQQLVI